MKRKSLLKSVIATLLAVVMVFGAIEVGLLSTAQAATAIAGTVNTIVDLDTSLKYSESLGDNASTEYSGRIWTDKSVYSDDVTFVTFGGGSSKIEKANDEDFLIAYSALGTSKAISGETHAPVDVVFIIDISGSMSNSDSRMDNGLSRIANTVAAVNASIDKLMSMNDYTRVAVTVFSDTATTLLPLDHYAKRTSGNTTYDYLTLNTQNAGGNVRLTVRATGDEEGYINEEIAVSGGTNIQMGLYEGMNILASAQDTTADINGSSVKRVPSVILLSDGAPTYSSGNSGNTQSNWWAPLNNNNDGPGSSPYYGNGFKALMTGAYMKNAINENYGVTGTNMQATLYTVGMGITDLDNYESSWLYQSYTGEQDLAYMTLNPGGNWNNDNDMAEDIRDAWTRYTNQTPNSNSTITVQTNSNENYTVRHPGSSLQDIYTSNNKDALKNLVNGYYPADNASSVASVFDSIVSNITISAPEVPTKLRTDDFMNTGFITYTDPIGEYMVVKDVKAIIYAGTTFTQKTKTVNGNTTTYVFEGTVESAVYGHQDIENIFISVTKDANENETLTVKIPAGVIPLRVNTVTLNADGSVKTHTNNGAYPARVIYSVAMKDGLKKVCDHGEVYVDLTRVSADYVKNNINPDGTINFYANYFDRENSNVVNGSTAGNTFVEFEPSHTNPFYYILENMPIYKDAGLTQQLPASEGIDEDTTYYYNDTYYHGTSVETTAIARTGRQLLNLANSFGSEEDAFVTIGGYLYRKPGSPRLNRILRFEGTKTLNATNTAQDFYGATFVHADGSTDPYEGKFKVYLGNNGVMSLLGGGNLKVTKIVDSAEGITAPDKDFTFTLDLNGDQVSALVLNYIVTDASGNQVATGTLSQNNNTFTLKDGQSATILSLPPETTYTVTENTESGFATNAVNATGVIQANETSEAVFTNTYSVTSVSLPVDTLKATKVLVGRTWADGDSFTFFLSPYNNAPLPAGYNSETGITITKNDVTGTTDAEFNFGSITFTAPGTYRYTIYEDEPANNEYLPGMSYSRALYRVEIIVEDNGAGALVITKTDIQKILEDNATPLFTIVNGELVMNQGQEAQDEIVFTNTFSASSVTRVPVALKNYTDLSGIKPLVSGMFNFKLEAVGYKVDGGSQINDITKVPMPSDAINGVSTTINEGHNVAFLPVEFTQATLNNLSATSVSFFYKISEVIPDGAVNNVYQGMIYDDTEFEIEVQVSIDPGSSSLIVNAIYPNGNNIATFNNTYSPAPATTEINGNKTFNGRNMLSGEAFNFTLTAADRFTSNAIDNNIVTVPVNSKSLINISDGSTRAFAFDGITFKKPGTYKFNVAETKGTYEGVTYDESVITVTIVVEDNNGVLNVVSKSYSNGLTSADFVNTYTSTFTDTPITLVGRKDLTGKSLLAGEFYFEVTLEDADHNRSSYLVTHEEDTQADASGVFSGAITFIKDKTFDKAGTYKFYIVEQNSGVNNTEYDSALFIYTVNILDDNRGNLYIGSTKLEKVVGSNTTDITGNEIVFTNSYTPTPITVDIPVGRKVIDGDRAIGLQAGEFKFMVSLAPNTPDGIILPTDPYVFNDANGHITFDDITFTKAGTYTIIISEVVPDAADAIPGITYSAEQHELTYRVVDDRIGNLTAFLTTLNNTVIVNGYTAQSDSINIEISKDLDGRDWLVTDEFFFKVEALDDTTKQAIADNIVEIQLDANSSDTITKVVTTSNQSAIVPVTFKKIGTYKFKVTEVNGNIAGITYDNAEYIVTVTVTDNSSTAQLETAVAIIKNNSPVQSIVFENTYNAQNAVLSGITNLKVEKDFTGRKDNAWLNTDQFVFTIAGADNDTLTAITNDDIVFTNTSITLTSANKDNAFFGDITFKEAGTYKFKVTETKGSIPGVTYDESQLYISVKVTDNKNLGKLEVEVVNEQSDVLTFSNTYSFKQTTVVFEDGLKVLEGRKLKDKEFNFIVKDANGKTVMNLTNDENGLIKFTELTFNEEGVYVYTINEVKGTDKETLYDEAVYTVEIVVTDNNNGQLVAQTSIKTDGKNVEKITFNNVAIAKPADTGDSFNNILMVALVIITTGFVLTTTVKKKKDSK